jgi:methyl-accepting chemotaxis protein
VDQGIELADRAGAALQQIVSGSGETVDMIAQIAAASEEQSTTSEQIARSVEMISSVAGESAKAIGQIAQAASGLRELTEDLKLQVQLLEGDSTEAVPQPAATEN